MNDDILTDSLFAAVTVQLGFSSPSKVEDLWIASRSGQQSFRQLLSPGHLSAAKAGTLDVVVASLVQAHAGSAALASQALAASAAQSGPSAALVLKLLDPSNTATFAPAPATTIQLDAYRTVSVSDGVDGERAPRSRPAHARFEKQSRLGRGGLGEVWLAHDSELNRAVALKEIRSDRVTGAESHIRFVNEAAITARLEHPGIVPVYAAGAYADGRPYYAMRRIVGRSFRQAIDDFHQRLDKAPDQHQRLTELRKLLRRFVDMCNAVGFAHSRGVLHRDLKPDNVMLGDYGETLVVDWGLAKQQANRGALADGDAASRAGSEERPASGADDPELTGSNAILGTVAYMSPEQASGRANALTEASDVYSLGATLYYLLTARTAFAGGSAGLAAVMKNEYPAPRAHQPWVPAALEAICQKAMSLRPEDRYATALELAADVDRWIADEPVSAHRDPLSVRVRRWARRHRVLVNTAALAIVLGIAALSYTTVRVSRERDEAEFRFGQARQAVDDNLLAVIDEPAFAHEELNDLKRSLLERGLAYYANFAKHKSDDLTLQAISAGARMRAGIIYQEMRSGKLARQAFEEAFALYDNLKRSGRLQPAWEFDLARGYHKYGDLITQTSGSAAHSSRAYDDALRRLAPLTDSPIKRQALFETAGVHESLGRWHKEQGSAAALDHCQKAVEIYQSLALGNDEDRPAKRGLAQSLVNLATVQQEFHYLPEAAANYVSARAAWQALDEVGLGGLEARAAQARILHDAGVMSQQQGDLEQATRFREEALALRRNAAYLHGFVFFQDLAQTKNDFGAQLCDQGKVQDGLRLLREAQQIEEELLAATGGKADQRVRLAQSLHAEANQFIRWRKVLDGPEGEQRCFEQASQILSRARNVLGGNSVASSEAPLDLQIERAANLHWEGYLALTQKDYERSEKEFTSAIAAWNELGAEGVDNVELLQSALRSQLSFANVALLQRRFDIALDRYRTVLATNERLVSLRPQESSYQLQRVTLTYSLANAQYRAHGATDEVFGLLESAMELGRPLLPRSGEDLTRVYRLLFEAAKRKGDVARVADAARDMRVVWPDDADKLVEAAAQLSWCVAALGNDRTKAEQCEGFAQQAVEFLEAAVAREPAKGTTADDQRFVPLKRFAVFQEFLKRQSERQGARPVTGPAAIQ